MTFQDKYLESMKVLDKLKIKQTEKQSELKIAYDYKEDVISKIQFADKQIANKQKEYHNLLVEIQSELSKLKTAFDLDMRGIGCC